MRTPREEGHALAIMTGRSCWGSEHGPGCNMFTAAIENARAEGAATTLWFMDEHGSEPGSLELVAALAARIGITAKQLTTATEGLRP